MSQKYSYQWFIHQFEEAKVSAKTLILSVDENQFIQPPAEGRWCIAECYSHLISYGDLYYDNLEAGVEYTQRTVDDLQHSFEPRWLFQKAVIFFEPPYKIKLKTVKPMKPDPVGEYNRKELLDRYTHLQNKFIRQLKKGRDRAIDLRATKIPHPIMSLLKMTLSECFALAEAHQRRHQWQAEQVLKILKNEAS